MKNRKLLVLLAIVLVAACNKPLPQYPAGSFDYKITGLDDTSLPANDFVIINPQMLLLSGNPVSEPLTLNFNGLPQGVSATQNNVTFRLNYSIRDTFIAHNATPGQYPVQAVFTGPSGTRSYNFDLTVAPPINRVAEVMGYYYPTNSCTDSQYISCTIDSVPGVPNKISFTDRIGVNSYVTYYGMVDCCTDSFTIPAQTVSGAIVQGGGSFTDLSYPYKTVHIHKTITQNGVTIDCIVSLDQE